MARLRLRASTCGKSIPLVLHRLNPGRISPPQSGIKLSQGVVPERLKREAPPSLGEERRGGYRVRALFFFFFLGKREIERLIFGRNAPHQLLRIFVPFRPDTARNPVLWL